MTNKTQKTFSYTNHLKITVYEALQYNKGSDEWYIVGDCSTNKEFIDQQVELHNLKLA